MFGVNNICKKKRHAFFILIMLQDPIKTTSISCGTLCFFIEYKVPLHYYFISDNRKRRTS